jgi:hypothetical protein
MHSSEFLNPVTIATKDAVRTFADPNGIEVPEYRDETLASLEAKAAFLGFKDAVFRLRVRRAVSAPADTRTEQPGKMYNFYTLEFMGKLLCYAKTKFEVPDETQQLTGLCLNFYETLLLPGADPLPKGHVLYVPVMAVEKIDPIPC